MPNLENAKLKAIMEEAEDAFWETVANKFPSADSGDLSPHVVVKLRNTMAEAIALWIEYNVPKHKRIANPELEGLQDVI